MTRKKAVTKTITDSETQLLTRYRVKCKNHKQKEFLNLITDKEIVFATGPAGVGKSYVAIGRGIELIQNVSNQYHKLVIINPAVEAEEKLGYMPGDLREKLDPFVASSIDIIDKIMGKKERLKLEENGTIVVGALGFLRGKTIDNSILVMEEAQNMSPHQMKTLLTRIGENTKFIISGDLDQSDRYSDFKQSGLYDGIEKHKHLDEIGFIEFNETEIVRNPLIALILKSYKKQNTSPNINKFDWSGLNFSNIPTITSTGTTTDNITIKTIEPKTKNNKRFFKKIKNFMKENFEW
jgi:phosphate starvation-inducible PhoH-like protein